MELVAIPKTDTDKKDEEVETAEEEEEFINQIMK